MDLFLLILFWALVAVVCFAIFVFFNPHFLYRDGIRRFPPFNITWHARHPDGEVSTVEYDYVNQNGKHFWKFNEYSEEVNADFGPDVFAEEGAYLGKAFFVFRCTRNGAYTVPWKEPSLRKAFEEAILERSSLEFESRGSAADEDLVKDTSVAGKTQELKKGDAKYREALTTSMQLETMAKFLGKRGFSKVGKFPPLEPGGEVEAGDESSGKGPEQQ